MMPSPCKGTNILRLIRWQVAISTSPSPSRARSDSRQQELEHLPCGLTAPRDHHVRVRVVAQAGLGRPRLPSHRKSTTRTLLRLPQQHRT